MGKTAILLGATGLTGSFLLDLLLDSTEYDKIKVFTRRETGKKHNKLEEIVCDLFHLEDYKDIFTADEVFCCIGTTKAKTADKKIYYDIDYGIPVKAAKLSEENDIKTFSVISAIGANADSSIFYSQTKGKMEKSVLAYNIPNILIYRPSLIFGKREDKRLGEQIAFVISKLIQKLLIGNWANYKYISGEDLAKAIYNGVKKHNGHKTIFRNDF